MARKGWRWVELMVVLTGVGWLIWVCCALWLVRGGKEGICFFEDLDWVGV